MSGKRKKKYYWLQLKRDFFNQKEIKLLRRIAGGDTYTVIYLKMLLFSLENESKLYYESVGDDFTEEIALSIDESPEDVSITVSYLEKKGLLEFAERDECFLNRVPELVGSEAYSTERSRRHRAKKRLTQEQEVLQCNTVETQSEHSCNMAQLRDRDRERVRYK